MFGDKLNLSKIAEIAKKGKEVKKEMDIANKEIEQMVVSSSSDCGNVKVICNGRGKISVIEVNQEAMTEEEMKNLNEILTSTVSKAQHQAAFITEERMKKITSALGFNSSQDINF